jgi:hypothetical protein
MAKISDLGSIAFDHRRALTIESRDSQVEYFPLGRDPV